MSRGFLRARPAGAAWCVVGLLVFFPVFASGCGSLDLSGGSVGPPEGAQSLTIETDDGASLAATAWGNGDTWIVAVPGATTDRSVWYRPGERIVASTSTRMLAFESRRGPSWDDDIAAAIAFAHANGARHVIVAASSASSQAALAKGALEDGVILVSPPAFTSAAVKAPVLVIAAESDGDAADAAKGLGTALGQSPVIVGGDGHGADLLRDSSAALDAVVSFVTARSR